MLCSASPAAALCDPIPNGGFSAGLAGWTSDPVITQVGQATGFADANVVDGAPFGPPLVGLAAMLSTTAHALGDRSGQSHHATAILNLSTVVIVTNRYLTFEALGSWEVLRAGAASGSYAFRADVIGNEGAVASRTFAMLNPLPPLPCGTGMSILGIIASDQSFVLDVLFDGVRPTGISLGDKVTLRITLQCSASAVTECDELEFAAAVLVDQFAFCPTGPCPADVNCDSHVNVDDLITVILDWGACPLPPGPCDADINHDSVVNVDDLIAVILAWGACA